MGKDTLSNFLLFLIVDHKGIDSQRPKAGVNINKDSLLGKLHNWSETLRKDVDTALLLFSSKIGCCFVKILTSDDGAFAGLKPISGNPIPRLKQKQVSIKQIGSTSRPDTFPKRCKIGDVWVSLQGDTPLFACQVISIEVNVFLVKSPELGKAIRINCMDKNNCWPSSRGCCVPLGQNLGLNSTTNKTFNTVSSRSMNQNFFR